MDLLKQEIERKRKELAEASANCNGKKYQKKGDLISAQTKIYIEKRFGKQKEDEEDNEKDELKSSNYSSKYDRNKLLQKSNETEKKILPRSEINRRLRERGQPICLFGETDTDAAKRLKIVETNEPREVGMRNDFKTAMDKSEQESLNEIMNSIETNKDRDATKSQTEVEIKDDAVTFNEILELSKDPTNNGNQLVLKYCKFIVKKWGQELNNRSLTEKLTTKGRIETALHTQTVADLKPILRKLKSKTLAEDILDSLVKIFMSLIKRNYIKANEYFLEMAIGNAPWPIGATMVIIHFQLSFNLFGL
jgi:pre-mRNA-splicing factor 18